MKLRVLNQARRLSFRKKKIEDDDSLSSTFSTHSTTKRTPSLESFPQLRVSFDEDCNVYHENTLIQEEEDVDAFLAGLWYSYAECEDMKVENTSACRNVCKAGREAAEAREGGTNNNDTYLVVLRDVYAGCCQVLSEEEELLLLSPSTAHVWLGPRLAAQFTDQIQLWDASRVGLERQLIKVIAASDKRARRQRLLHLAYNLAKEHPSMSPDTLTTLMRVKCEEITRPAKLFAAMTARAQEC